MIRALAVCALLAGCADPPQTVVFAAASTTDVVEAVVARHPDADGIAVSIAASSVLAQQIAAGAPADIFVSADRQWVDWLSEQGVRINHRHIVATGRLVVVGPPGSDQEAPFQGRVAIADPSHVPAGHYARRALDALGQWTTVKPKAVFVADVRAALAAVQTGAADRAIVFASDIYRQRGVEVVYRFPEMPEIQFVVAEIGAGGSVYDSLVAARPWLAAGFEAAP